MRTIDITTQIGGLEDFGFEGGAYPLTIQQFDNVSEMIAKIGKVDEAEVAVEAPQGALDAILGVGNAAQKQGASQGGKEVIRDVMSRDLKEGEDRDELVAAAVAAHQASRAGYIIGAPRGGGSGGVTKTKASNIGKALLEKLGGEKLDALAAKFGLSEDDLK